MADNDDYYIFFKGAKVTKKQGNRIGIGILFGIIGSVIIPFLPIGTNRSISYCILLSFVLVGYFIIAPRIFR